MAELIFEYGPMGSQKTAKLLLTAYNINEHGCLAVVTKPLTDTKGDTRVESRAGLEREVDFLADPEMDIEAEIVRRQGIAREQNKSINALLVDEAQFLVPKQVDQLFAIAVLRNINVYAFGLRSDFQTNSFPGSLRLMEIAHTIRESQAMCGAGDGCDQKAIFNARKENGVYVTEGSQVAIDGKDATYASLCGKHYMDLVGPIGKSNDGVDYASVEQRIA